MDEIAKKEAFTKQRDSMKILDLLREAQNLFSLTFGKPLKQIAEAYEAVSRHYLASKPKPKVHEEKK